MANATQLNWFRDTIMVALPEIKAKLTMLHVPAQYLSIHDSLEGLDKMVIESDEWRNGNLDFINHGLTKSG